MATAYPSVAGVRFKDVAGWPGYCVGDDGSPWSCRIISSLTGLGNTWRKLKGIPTKGGYILVQLFSNSRRKTFHVHRLVLDAFVGPRPAGMECRHLDGNPKNNRLDNLCWGTKTENRADSMRHGTLYRKPGEDHPDAFLTEALVREIMQLRLTEGIGYKKISKRLNIDRVKAVEAVIVGKSWNHVTGIPKWERRK
jgi:hypothetical protein